MEECWSLRRELHCGEGLCRLPSVQELLLRRIAEGPQGDLGESSQMAASLTPSDNLCKLGIPETFCVG